LGLRLKKGEQLDWWWSMYDMPSLWPVVVGDGVDVPRMYHETTNVAARGKEVSGVLAQLTPKSKTRNQNQNFHTAVRLFFPNPFKKKRKKQQEIPPT